MSQRSAILTDLPEVALAAAPGWFWLALAAMSAPLPQGLPWLRGRFIATVKRPGLMVFLNNRTLVHDRGERGKTILIFSNPITGKEKRRLNLKGWLYAIAAEGRRVALVNKDDSLSIRTLPGGKQLC